jgi:Lar family restriction alleviation protein
MSDIEIIPCPFCGSTNISVVETSTFRWRAPECQECGAVGPEVRIQTMGDGTKEEWEEAASIAAIQVWNDRAMIAAAQKGSDK